MNAGQPLNAVGLWSVAARKRKAYIDEIVDIVVQRCLREAYRGKHSAFVQVTWSRFDADEVLHALWYRGFGTEPRESIILGKGLMVDWSGAGRKPTKAEK